MFSTLALRASVAAHEGVKTSVRRAIQFGADRGASHTTEIAGGMVLIGGVWVAVNGLGLDDTISEALETGATDALDGK